MRKNRFFLPLLVVLFTATASYLGAQVNHLGTPVSIDIRGVKLKDALPKIAARGGFQFSYNSDIIPGDSLVTVQAENRQVREVLGSLLGPGIRYKVVGNHIILLADKKMGRNEKRGEAKEYTITGYIYDSQTGEILSSASIYEVEGMFVAATDETGRYSLTVPGDQEKQVSYSKAGYADTLIVVRPKEQPEMNISLRPKQRPVTESQLAGRNVESLGERRLVRVLVPSRALITAQNVETEEQRWGQLSLFPFIGSNRFVSGLITNRLSLNIFAGYSGGLRGVELGGFLNVVRKEMHGFQVAGFGNIVGRKSHGVQLSGFFNWDAGSFGGLQASGFSNVVTDTIRGVQLAGFSNVLRGPMYGTQISGFSNFTSQNVDGIQASGFLNIAGKDVKLAQISGFANYGKSVGGLQAAGFMNIASGTSKGLQVSGFLNYAHELQGVQWSVFNIADTVSSGVPIGLISYVRKGYHPLEITANELIPFNLTFKTGIRKFYSIFTGGIQQQLLSLGYGLGTQFRLARKLTLSMDLTGHYLTSNTSFLASKGSWVRLAPTFDIQLAKHFTVVFGPTLNAFAGLDHADADTGDFPFLFSLPVKNLMVVSTPVSIRIGATAGFRF
jgi:hypothetical protein